MFHLQFYFPVELFLPQHIEAQRFYPLHYRIEQVVQVQHRFPHPTTREEEEEEEEEEDDDDDGG